MYPHTIEAICRSVEVFTIFIISLNKFVLWQMVLVPWSKQGSADDFPPAWFSFDVDDPGCYLRRHHDILVSLTIPQGKKNALTDPPVWTRKRQQGGVWDPFMGSSCALYTPAKKGTPPATPPRPKQSFLTQNQFPDNFRKNLENMSLHLSYAGM